MKEIRFYLLLIITMIAFLSSCADDNEDKTELPPWNKANTISVYFLSKMDGGSMFGSTSEYSTVKNYLGGKTSYKMALLDCCDLIDYANDKNPTVSLAYDLDKVSSFALNSFKDNKPAGTGILLDQLISVQKEIKLDEECYLKTIDIQVLSSKESKFAIVKLSKESHIDRFANEVSNLLKERIFLVGSIKKELYSKLESKFNSNSAGYRLEKSNSTDGNYIVFTLVSKDWISRDISTETTGNIHAFRIQLELLN